MSTNLLYQNFSSQDFYSVYIKNIFIEFNKKIDIFTDESLEFRRSAR